MLNYFALQQIPLTLSCTMLKNCQAYLKNPETFKQKDFESMLGHFLTLCMKGLIVTIKNLIINSFSQLRYIIKSRDLGHIRALPKR